MDFFGSGGSSIGAYSTSAGPVPPTPPFVGENLFDVLTPLSKTHRITRRVDIDNFIIFPGMWAELKDDGWLYNITTDTPGLVNLLVIGDASASLYETHDVKVKRVTTVEIPGVRCRANGATVHMDDMAIGSELVVSTDAGEEGKLAVTTQVQSGDYVVVGEVLTFDSVNEIITYQLVSPRTITV